ncbi:transglutaminase-like domain-containing protein [Sphingomonas sp. H160509]|uniref:transglutaminase-like domain-containing protein n=1 Tax=Sphingomonas sp. H160509 TaxID=2955313 RepID=UPI003158993D
MDRAAAETTALDTFASRSGVCRDYSHLLVSLARAGGIPARCVSAYAPGVDPPDFHAVAELWLAGGLAADRCDQDGDVQ